MHQGEETMEVSNNHPECSGPIPSYSETRYTSSTYGWQWPPYPLYPSYPPPPLSTNPLQSTISVGAQYIYIHLGSNDYSASETPPKRH